MRRTHNLKYPTEKITQEDLTQTKRKLAEFVEGKENEEMSYKQFYKWFGEGLDLFYFGVYSIEETKTPPWRREKEAEEDRDGAAVAPTYGVCIQDMLENECEEISQKKEEEKEKKRKKEEEEAKKKGWFSWFW